MDRLGEADYQVGLFYYRQRWYPGSIDRFSSLLKSDPEFSNRDSVYFYLAESYVKTTARRPSAPLLREARERIREKRAPAGSPETDRRTEGPGSQQVLGGTMASHRVVVLAAVCALVASGAGRADTRHAHAGPDRGRLRAAARASPRVPAEASRIIGSQDSVNRNVFGTPEVLVISGGTDTGMVARPGILRPARGQDRGDVPRQAARTRSTRSAGCASSP